MGVGPPMGFGMGMRPPMGGPMGQMGGPMGPMGGMPPGGPRAIAHYTGRPRRDIPSGPAVTIFVGNITERAPDAMVRHLLTTCGPVISWKRVQGATGKLQAFGFCEYSNPDAGLRAIRLLNKFSIAEKDLVVKVDSKTRKILEEYVSDRIKKGGEDVEVPKEDEIENYEDEDMKYEDGLTRDRIQQILVDHAKEIESYIPKEATALPQAREQVPSATLIQRMGTRDEGLDDVEPEKIGIINSEIHKFRETMKMREAEKEEQQDKKRDRKSPSRKRSRSREDPRDSRGRENRSRDRERERERERSSRHRSKSVERRRPAPSRSKSRSPVRFDRERMRGSRDRDNRSQKEIYKDREMEEEEKERKRAERKAREKEEGYQERLRAWETREGKKAKEYEAYSIKEKKKTEEQEREARKLKEFLEDYDDERDDPKFYKGRELQRRLTERERESVKDAEDRRKELDEIEELKSTIYSDPRLADPATEFQRRLQERERQFLPGRDRRRSDSSQAPPSHLSNTANSPITLDGDSPEQSPDIEALPPPAPADTDSLDSSQDTPDPPQLLQPPSELRPATATTIHKTKVETKRKKLPVADIFNQEDDDDADKPKKKLKPLPPLTTDAKKDNKSADEKRKHIKSLIEKIPTDKTDLFAYNIDWDLVDNQLMEKRIRPWVNKKIAEYIGEPEPSLTDFICSKVLAGSTPKAILEDVQMVLDEEAEVFVVKMWRLLIYEIENKKQKSQGVVTK